MFNLLAIIWVHWWADFYCQSDKIACNKSKDFLVLGAHCLIYGVCMLVFGWKFALLNAVAHFIVDAASSRWTAHLFGKGDRHNFFVVIGLDQAVHMSVLIASAKYLGIIYAI